MPGSGARSRKRNQTCEALILHYILADSAMAAAGCWGRLRTASGQSYELAAPDPALEHSMSAYSVVFVRR